MLETFTSQTFTPLVHDTFRVVLDSAPEVRLELMEVQELAREGPVPPAFVQARTPFSLVFHGPRDFLLPQRIYHLEHATLGSFDLFLVPLGPQAQSMRYEAVFS